MKLLSLLQEALNHNFLHHVRNIKKDQHTELVPLKVLWKFLEFDRAGESGEARKNISQLQQSLYDQGFTEALIIEYYVKNKTAVLREGNHRLAAARNLQIPFIPVKVVLNKWEQRQGAKPVPGIEPDQWGHLPAMMTPSQIGIEGCRKLSGEEVQLQQGPEPENENIVNALERFSDVKAGVEMVEVTYDLLDEWPYFQALFDKASSIDWERIYEGEGYVLEPDDSQLKNLHLDEYHDPADEASISWKNYMLSVIGEELPEQAAAVTGWSDQVELWRNAGSPKCRELYRETLRHIYWAWEEQYQREYLKAFYEEVHQGPHGETISPMEGGKHEILLSFELEGEAFGKIRREETLFKRALLAYFDRENFALYYEEPKQIEVKLEHKVIMEAMDKAIDKLS